MSQSHTPAAVGDDTVMPADGNSGIAARMQNPNTEHQTGTAVGNTAPSTLQDEFEAWLVANCTTEQLQEVYDIFALYPGQAFTPSSLDAEELIKQVTQAFHDPSLLKGPQQQCSKGGG